MKQRPRGVEGKIIWQKKNIFFKDGQALHDQINETFLQKQYDFISTKKNPLLIDCGAHVGIVSLRWRQLFPNASITAIEADPAIGRILEKNLVFESPKNTRVIKKAVWVHDHGVRFNSSGLDNGNIEISESRGMHLPSVDLTALISGEVEMLKMDIEGAEYQVLQKLHETKKLKQIARIIIEIHHWDTCANPLPNALCLLQQNGFDSRIVSSVLFKKKNEPVFSEQGWVHSHVVVAAKRMMNLQKEN